MDNFIENVEYELHEVMLKEMALGSSNAPERRRAFELCKNILLPIIKRCYEENKRLQTLAGIYLQRLEQTELIIGKMGREGEV